MRERSPRADSMKKATIARKTTAGKSTVSLTFEQIRKRKPTKRQLAEIAALAALPDDEVMVNIVATIARAMQIRLVAEGVETPQQRDWLLSRNIVLGQGYLFSPPLPQAEFEAKYLSEYARPE